MHVQFDADVVLRIMNHRQMMMLGRGHDVARLPVEASRFQRCNRLMRPRARNQNIEIEPIA